MSQGVRYKRNENVTYNHNGVNESATVVSNRLGLNKVKIRLSDGTIVKVDRNSLSSIFDMKKENPYLEERIAECDEEIEENWNKIQKAKKMHAQAIGLIHACRKHMRQILSAYHATTYKQITDETQRNEYLALNGQKYDAIRLRNRATNEICDTAHSTGSVCFTKSGLLNQQALFEHFTQVPDVDGYLG